MSVTFLRDNKSLMVQHRTPSLLHNAYDATLVPPPKARLERVSVVIEEAGAYTPEALRGRRCILSLELRESSSRGSLKTSAIATYRFLPARGTEMYLTLFYAGRDRNGFERVRKS